MEIKLATEADLGTMLGLARQMHGESNYATLPFDDQVTTETLRAAVRSRLSGVWLAVDKEHTMGFISGQVTRAMFSQEVVAQDKVLFVRPEYRGRGVMVELVKAYCLWAAELGARRITISSSAGSEDEPFVRKLSARGFNRAGSVMYMEVG